MHIFYRLYSAWLCLWYGYAPIPPDRYTTICLSEHSLLLTSLQDSEKSLDVALWALEKPKHYWKSTALGAEVYSKAQEAMQRAEDISH